MGWRGPAGVPGEERPRGGWVTGGETGKRLLICLRLLRDGLGAAYRPTCGSADHGERDPGRLAHTHGALQRLFKPRADGCLPACRTRRKPRIRRPGAAERTGGTVAAFCGDPGCDLSVKDARVQPAPRLRAGTGASGARRSTAPLRCRLHRRLRRGRAAPGPDRGGKGTVPDRRAAPRVLGHEPYLRRDRAPSGRPDDPFPRREQDGAPLDTKHEGVPWPPTGSSHRTHRLRVETGSPRARIRLRGLKGLTRCRAGTRGRRGQRTVPRDRRTRPFRRRCLHPSAAPPSRAWPPR